MASKRGKVTLRGRFPAGERVSLVKVSSEAVLRSEGGEKVADATVSDDGSVTFDTDVGARYFVVGRRNGQPLEVRITGRDYDGLGLTGQAPVGYEPPPAVRSKVDPDSQPYGMRLAQEQVSDKVAQRSATLHGTAHPMDPDERGPYPSQQDEEYSSGKTQQRSDTEFGQATPIHDRVSRQEETDGKVQQRSDTPLGVATPLPQGDAVAAVKGIESAEIKAAAGEPSQADARGVADLGSPKAERAAKEPKDAPAPADPAKVAEKDEAEASEKARSRARK